VKLIPFYKVYRAFVRGKVESLQLLDTGIGDVERTAAEKRALRYFRLAQGYCLKSRLPLTLFITCGTMGCGKSTLADQLAFELGLAVFNSDIVRKQIAGLESETAVHVSYGAGIYTKEMTCTTYRRLEQLADNELVSGRSVVIDAGFGSRAERIVFARLAASYHAHLLILFVQCHQDEQRKRLHERSLRGTSVSDGRIELLDQQTSSFEPPDNSEGIVIPCATSGTTEHSLDLVVQSILHTASNCGR
jgi:predicted kinase